MSDKKGQELASISISLNSGIVAGIFALGFVVSALLFGVATFIIKVA